MQADGGCWTVNMRDLWREQGPGRAGKTGRCSRRRACKNRRSIPSEAAQQRAFRGRDDVIVEEL